MVKSWLEWGRRRRDALGTAAASMGLSFDGEPPFEIGAFEYGLESGNQGNGAKNVVHGRFRSRPVTVFDWTAHTRKDTYLDLLPGNGPEHSYKTVRQTVVAVELGREVCTAVLERRRRPRRSDRNRYAPTGHADLDGAFVCTSYHPAVATIAAMLADEQFARAVLAEEELSKVVLRSSRMVLVLRRRHSSALADTVQLADRVAELLPQGIYRAAADAEPAADSPGWAPPTSDADTAASPAAPDGR